MIVRDAERTLGQNLRTWRRTLRLTVQDAATSVGISKGYLSRIENDQASPSIAVLQRLSASYQVPLANLLEIGEESPRFSLVRRADRLSLNRDGSEHGYIYELINHRKADRRTECFVVTLPPVTTQPGLFRHDGEELFFVLEGRVRFVYGGTETLLEVGDAVYFDASIEHRGLAEGGAPALALAVIVPSVEPAAIESANVPEDDARSSKNPEEPINA